MLKMLLNPLERERFQWIALMIIFESIFLLTLIIKIFSNQNSLKDLLFNDKQPFGHKNESKTVLKIRFLFLITIILGFYYITSNIAIVLNREQNTNKTVFEYRLEFGLPVYSTYLWAQVFYITICWIICLKFRDLNSYIKVLIKGKERNVEELQEVIDWFNDNIKQMSTLNKVFSLPLSCFFFTYVCGLVLAVEEFIFYHNRQSIPILFVNIGFIIQKTGILIYIIKQTIDISREASKTSKLVDEFCQPVHVTEVENLFDKKVGQNNLN
jgi:hypothetical protein